MKKSRLLVIVLLLTWASGFGQPYYFRHYQVENGLSHNSVFSSVQDKAGFLWFGTKDGLNRFDGYRFKLFHTNTDDENNLAIDVISDLAIDADGTLWVGAESGLFYFDAQQEQLVRVADSLIRINNLVVDKQGRLWFTSYFDLFRYDIARKKNSLVAAAKSFKLTALSELPDGRMAMAAVDGDILLMEPATQQLTIRNVFDHSPHAASQLISKLLPGNNNNIYIGTTNQGLKEFNLATLTYEDLVTSNPDQTAIFVRDIIPFSTNQFWLATESGIFIYNSSTNQFNNLRKKYLDPYSLSDNAVYTLTKDSEGGIWAGTYFGGLNYFAKGNLSFEKYFPDYSRNSVSGSAVREIVEDGFGNLWIGTEDAGLDKLNIKTGEVTQFKPTGSPSSIDYSNIHGLAVVGNELWVGTFEHGLNILDIASGKVVRRHVAGPGPHELKSNFIVSLLKTSTGDIYLGGSNSLCRYSATDGRFHHLQNPSGDSFVSCLLEDKNGTIWVGTHDRGLFFIDPATGKTGRFQYEPGNKNSLTTNTINALYEDRHNNLWMALEGGGLCQLAQDRRTFTRFTIKNGLPSNIVFKVLEDNNGMLWVTTSKGLVKMDPATKSMTVYTKSNGLLNDQFNYNSGYRDAAGRLYFGSVRGMITFRPDDFTPVGFVPPIYITGIQVHNRELEVSKDTNILRKSIVYTNKIKLSYDQSSISIDFAALSFASPEVTAYSYIMEGLDKEWTYLKTNRKVYFTNLAPGTYTLRLKAQVNGTAYTAERRLTITITPPFWATPWAYLFYFVLAASLLYYLIRTYHNMLTNKKEKEIYEAKIEFFTNIAHEIKTPLTLIKGPVENLAELTPVYPEIEEDVVTMERNTARLINLVSQILDFRQTETKGFSLDFNPVQLKEILNESFITFKPIARKRNLNYSMELPSSPISIMADDEALVKIFSNLFSNAVKYADRFVEIRLIPPAKSDEHVQIEFRNDGYLVPADMKEKIFEPFYRLKQSAKLKGTGIGLALARSLVELHNGELFLGDEEEGLNVFIVRLPYSHQQTAKRQLYHIHQKM